MPIDCNPQALLDASQEFCCIPKGKEMQILIYLVNILSGLNLTPQQLMDNSAPYGVIPKGMEMEVLLYLLCQNANAAGA